MGDLDNRIRLKFHIAYSRLAERGLITEDDLARIGELLDNLDTLDEASVRRALDSIGADRPSGDRGAREETQ